VSVIRKSSLALVAIGAAIGLVFAAGTASASTSGAHFTATSDSVNSAGALVATFSEGGLGNENVHYSLTANGSATYACINGGGKHAQASNKETVTEPVTCSGEFSSGKNGNIIGSLTCPLPGAGEFSCPSGQTLTLTSVSYSGISLTDNTNNIVEDAAPSALSACLISGPVLDRDPQLCPQP